MPKKMIADVDDIIQIRNAWADLVKLASELGMTREEIAALVTAWVEALIERAE